MVKYAHFERSSRTAAQIDVSSPGLRAPDSPSCADVTIRESLHLLLHGPLLGRAELLPRNTPAQSLMPQAHFPHQIGSARRYLVLVRNGSRARIKGFVGRISWNWA